MDKLILENGESAFQNVEALKRKIGKSVVKNSKIGQGFGGAKENVDGSQIQKRTRNNADRVFTEATKQKLGQPKNFWTDRFQVHHHEFSHFLDDVSKKAISSGIEEAIDVDPQLLAYVHDFIRNYNLTKPSFNPFGHSMNVGQGVGGGGNSPVPRKEMSPGLKESSSSSSSKILSPKSANGFIARMPNPPSIFSDHIANSSSSSSPSDIDDAASPRFVHVNLIRADDVSRLVKLIDEFVLKTKNQSEKDKIRKLLADEGIDLDQLALSVQLAQLIDRSEDDWSSMTDKDFVSNLLHRVGLDVEALNQSLHFVSKLKEERQNPKGLDDLFENSGMSVNILRQTVDYVLKMKQGKLIEGIEKQMDELTASKELSLTATSDFTNKLGEIRDQLNGAKNHFNDRLVVFKGDIEKLTLADSQRIRDQQSFSEQLERVFRRPDFSQVLANIHRLQVDSKKHSDFLQFELPLIVTILQTPRIQMMTHTCSNVPSGGSSSELFFVPWVQLKMRKPGRLISLTVSFIDTAVSSSAMTGMVRDPTTEKFEITFEAKMSVANSKSSKKVEGVEPYHVETEGTQKEIDEKFWIRSKSPGDGNGSSTIYRAKGKLTSDKNFQILRDENGTHPAVNFRIEFSSTKIPGRTLTPSRGRKIEMTEEEKNLSFQWNHPCELTLSLHRYNKFLTGTVHLVVLNTEFQMWKAPMSEFFESRLPNMVEAEDSSVFPSTDRIPLGAPEAAPIRLEPAEKETEQLPTSESLIAPEENADDVDGDVPSVDESAETAKKTRAAVHHPPLTFHTPREEDLRNLETSTETGSSSNESRDNEEDDCSPEEKGENLEPNGHRHRKGKPCPFENFDPFAPNRRDPEPTENERSGNEENNGPKLTMEENGRDPPNKSLSSVERKMNPPGRVTFKTTWLKLPTNLPNMTKLSPPSLEAGDSSSQTNLKDSTFQSATLSGSDNMFSTNPKEKHSSDLDEFFQD